MSTDPRVTRQGRLGAAYLTWTDDAGDVQTLVFDCVVSEEWVDASDITDNPVEKGASISDNIRPQVRHCRLEVFATNEPIQSNQWANADLGANFALALPSHSWSPDTSPLDVMEWDSKLEARVLAGSAGGAIGSAVGGPVGGAIGALAGGLIAGALFEPEAVHVKMKHNAGLKPSPPRPSLSPITLGFDDADDYVLKTIALLEDLHQRGQTIDVIGTKTACIGPPGIGGMAIEALSHVRSSDEGTGATITIGFKQVRIVSTTTVPAPKPSIPRAKAPVKKGNKQGNDTLDAFGAGFKKGMADITDLLGGGS